MEDLLKIGAWYGILVVGWLLVPRLVKQNAADLERMGIRRRTPKSLTTILRVAIVLMAIGGAWVIASY